MAIAKLSIDLEARLAGLQAGLDKAGLLAERQAARIEGAFKGVGTAVTGLGALLVGAFSVAGIGAFIRSTVDGLDALNDLSDATGASIENLSALEDVAARTGTSFETTGAAVIRLNKVLGDAKPGSDAAKAIEALGLSVENLKKEDPAEALRQVAVALSGFADDGAKGRFQIELLGKGAATLAPLLKDLATQGKLNATVTTEQAQAAEAFNNQLSELSKNATDVSRNITSALIPSVNAFFKALNQNTKAGGFFSSIILETDANLASDRLRVVVKQIEDFQKVIDRQGATPLLANKMAALRVEAKRLTNEAQSASDALKAFAGVASPYADPADYSNEGRNRPRPALPGGGGGGGGGSKGGGSKALPVIGPVFDQAGLAAITALERTDTVKIAQLNAQLTALFDLQRETRGAPAVAEAIAKTREELAKLDPATQAAAKDTERLNAILAATPSGQLAKVIAEIEFLNTQLAAGKLTYEQWGEAARSATSRAGSQSEAEIEKISTFADQAGRNIQDALGTTLEQTLRGNFSSIGDLWRDLLLNMAAQAAAAQLNKYLFGDGIGAASGKGGVATDLFKTFAGFFATGGTLGAGQWGIAGEAGPEIVKGPAQIVPAGGRSGGGVTMVYNINGDVSPQTVALIRNMGASVKADILRSTRQGGAYAGAY